MSTTWLDRAISWAAPQRGLARTRARVMESVLTDARLGYEGARTGRRTDGWVTPSSSADAEQQASGARLRDRARALVRDNPYASRAVEVKVANTIGTGIVGEVKHKKLAARWEQFVEECDFTGQRDLYGIQDESERSRSVAGETLIRLIKNGPGIPLKLMPLEPDYIDESRQGTTDDGARVVNGLEYDRAGRVVAYYLYQEHPGNASSTFASFGTVGLRSNRVPASEIIHLFRKLRPGQTRGVSDFAPVIMRSRDLDDYDDAEVMRKKVEACLAAFITTPGGADSEKISPTVSTDDEGRVEAMYPGMMTYLRTGEMISFSNPTASGGYADFQRAALRAIATGLHIPYELLSGDLSQVNYSSYRAGLVDFRRQIEQLQWTLYVPVLLNRIWREFMGAVAISDPGIGARTVPQWSPPRFELIDPLKETMAELAACQAGFDSWPEIVRRRGWTSEEQLDEIEAWQKELDRRGIVLTSDARVSSGSTATAAKKPDPPDDDEEDDDAEAA